MNEPCKFQNCNCFHISPCEQGWIFYIHKETTQRTVKGVVYELTREYDSVRPCPTCDPERAQIFESSKSSEELAQRLQQRSQFKVAENYDKLQASKTRTL